MTKAELDERLRGVRLPAPVIHVGPAHPISNYKGYNDPHPGFYLGARVQVDEELMDQCWVEELHLE